MSDNEQRHVKKSQLVLTFDSDTFDLVVTGNVASLPCAIAMLTQATRIMLERDADARRKNISPADVRDILEISRGRAQ